MKKKQRLVKGSALIQVMFATLGASALIGLVVRQTIVEQKEMKLQSMKEQRNNIAKTLEEQLVNVQFIRASTAADVTYPGNRALRTCLGVDYQSEGTPVPPNAAKNCINGNLTAFALVPAQDYVFPPSTADSNCPNKNAPATTRHVSCFLAGDPGGKAVGYSFKGDTGLSGANFPLRVRAYFEAVCPDDNTKTVGGRCVFADSVRVRYEIEHFDAKLNKRGILGVYPQTPHWLTVNRTNIVGQVCNTGAKVAEFDQSGFVVCRCQWPYRQKTENDKITPKVNARGPLCEPMAADCPAGLRRTGADKNGDPICEQVQREVIGIGSAFTDSEHPDPPNKASCEIDGRKGWATKIQTRCGGAIQFHFQESIEIDWAAIIAMGLLGLMIGIYVAAIIIMATGVGIIAGMFIIIGAMAAFITGFAILGFLLFGIIDDWFIIDKNKRDNSSGFPFIYCTMKVDCRAYK